MEVAFAWLFGWLGVGALVMLLPCIVTLLVEGEFTLDYLWDMFR